VGRRLLPLAVGLLALLATFSTGYTTLDRASIKGTATVLADKTMEAYRGQQFGAIAAGTTTATYSGATVPRSPDGRTYTVNSTVTPTTATNTSGSTARTVKLITVTVTDSNGRQWATEQSTFDSLTG
jgi:hypothetical protein